MPDHADYDAIIVGAGPNGLAAAITLAREGWSALVLEASDTIGGGTRTAELTLPGFQHDICSAIHPLGLASPFIRALPLADHGLRWIQPPAPVAHPLPGGDAVVIERSLEATSATFGVDERAYRDLFSPYVDHWEDLLEDILGPLRIPKHPVLLGRFGLQALRSATGLAKSVFKGERARAAFAGHAGHSIQPLEHLGTAAPGLVEGILAHAVGWSLAEGGSQRITEAMASYLVSLGGEIVTGVPVRAMGDIPSARAVLFNLTPRQVLEIAHDRLPPGYRRQLARYRYGPGACKVDFALDGPIPWEAEAVQRAATVHIGGTLAEISASEQAIWHGEHAERPFVLLAQQSLFDPSRAPAGKHTAWAYCHVPHGSTCDASPQIVAQIERFAPGFKDRILAQHVFTAMDMERYNANYIGGDIIGGVQDLRQQFTRPVASLVPYRMPARGLYLCSSSTPPGGGVHGLGGYFAAQTVLKDF